MLSMIFFLQITLGYYIKIITKVLTIITLLLSIAIQQKSYYRSTKTESGVDLSK